MKNIFFCKNFGLISRMSRTSFNEHFRENERKFSFSFSSSLKFLRKRLNQIWKPYFQMNKHSNQSFINILLIIFPHKYFHSLIEIITFIFCLLMLNNKYNNYNNKKKYKDCVTNQFNCILKYIFVKMSTFIGLNKNFPSLFSRFF